MWIEKLAPKIGVKGSALVAVRRRRNPHKKGAKGVWGLQQEVATLSHKGGARMRRPKRTTCTMSFPKMGTIYNYLSLSFQNSPGDCFGKNIQITTHRIIPKAYCI